VKYLISILFVIITLNLLGQDLIYVNELDVSVDGDFIIPHPNGKPREICYTVKNHKVDGVIYVRYEGGSNIISYDIKNGKYWGENKVYNLKGRATIIQTTRNDSLISEYANETYLNGVVCKEWIWNRKDDKNIEILNKTYFGLIDHFWMSAGALGRINGTIRRFYKNGQVKKIKSYVVRKKDGEWIWFRKDGSIKRKRTYHYDKT